MKTLVFGCGPAGLMAAHAAALEGSDVHIFSKKRKSELFGAQYLHEPIPGIDNIDTEHVTYELRGTANEYREKVYGKNWRGTVSPQDLEEDHPAWDIRGTYDRLWRMYGPFVQDYEVFPGSVSESMRDGRPDLIVNSIPRGALCVGLTHTFKEENVWAIGDAPERGKFCPVKVPEATVVCSGERDVSWYRAANVFGYSTAEWSYDKRPPYEGAAMVRKPLETDCDCHRDVLHVGRYGKWKKGVLSHTAFFDVRNRIRNGVQEPLDV